MYIYPIYYRNWRNISTVYIHNKTSIKGNILTIKQNTREVGRAKDLPASQYETGPVQASEVLPEEQRSAVADSRCCWT